MKALFKRPVTEKLKRKSYMDKQTKFVSDLKKSEHST